MDADPIDYGLNLDISAPSIVRWLLAALSWFEVVALAVLCGLIAALVLIIVGVIRREDE